MLPEGQIGVSLQVLGQPLPQCLALNGRSTGDQVDVEVPGLVPPFQPALDGGAGDSEELLDLPPWDATVYGGECPQS